MSDTQSVNAPTKPVIADECDHSVHVATLAGGQRPLEIQFEKAIDFFLGMLSADEVRANIACRICHSSVFPIDDMNVVFGGNEIAVAHVVVAHDMCDLIGIDESAYTFY